MINYKRKDEKINNEIAIWFQNTHFLLDIYLYLINIYLDVLL